jgi:hypothetical protein
MATLTARKTTIAANGATTPQSLTHPATSDILWKLPVWLVLMDCDCNKQTVYRSTECLSFAFAAAILVFRLGVGGRWVSFLIRRTRQGRRGTWNFRKQLFMPQRGTMEVPDDKGIVGDMPISP